MFTYLLPWAYSSFFDLSGISSYRIYPVHIWAICLVAAISICLVLLEDRKFLHPRPSPASMTPWVKTRLGLSITFVLVGVLSLLQGLNGFRYSNQSIFAEGNIVVYLLSLAPITIKFDLLLQLFYREGGENTKLDALIRVLFFVALVLTASGTASALFAFLYLGYTLRPQGFRNLVSGSVKRIKFSRVLLLGAAAAVLLGLGWTLGESIKRNGNYEMVFKQVTDVGFIEWFSIWLMDRFSSSYYSTLMAIHDYLVRVDMRPVDNLLVPLKSLLYRVDVLLGRPYEVARPDTVSIMRLNYELLALDINPREGTSPGLLGGFLLCFPFPVNLIVLVGYCFGLVRLFNRLIRSTVRSPNVLGLLLFLFVGLVFFESPIDFLLIVDDGTYSLLLFGWLLWRASRGERDVRASLAGEGAW